MTLNADYGARVVIDTRTAPWAASSEPGVERHLLDQAGGTGERTTCIERHAPGSVFESDGLGEECLVLSGSFEDEEGVYPAGAYVRTRPGARRRCATASGCELFVKRGQFQAGDDAQVAIDTRSARFRPGLVPGLTVLPLHEFGGEHVAFVRWAPGTRFQPHTHWGGEEILVLDGVFSDEHGDYPACTWIRSPHLSRHHPFSEPGCLIYVKVGHLNY